MATTKRYYLTKLIGSGVGPNDPYRCSSMIPGASVTPVYPPHDPLRPGHYATDVVVSLVEAENFKDVNKDANNVFIGEFDKKDLPLDIDAQDKVTSKLLAKGVDVPVDGVKSVKTLVRELCKKISPDQLLPGTAPTIVVELPGGESAVLK